MHPSSRCTWPAGLLAAALLLTATAVTAADAQYSYDGNGRLVAVTFADGSRNDYVYDKIGNITLVTKVAAAPVWLTQFAPVAAAIGAPVTIQGGGFSVSAAANTVKFNGTQAVVTAATATSLTVSVPAGATSGKLTVSNANGTATSTTDFIVAGLVPGGPPQAVTVGANQSASYKFTGAAGDGLTLVLTGISTAPVGTVTALVQTPTAATLTSCSSAASHIYCQLPYLPSAGTYQVKLSAGASAVKLNLALVPDVKGSLTLAGAAVKTSLLTPGQAISYSFNGTVGQQNLNVNIADDLIYGQTSFVVYRPDAVQLASATISYASGAGSGGAVSLPSLPQTGMYKMRATPVNGAVGSMVAGLSQDVGGTMVPDGAAIPLSLSSNKGRFSFSGTVGQRLGVGVSGLSTSPAGGSLTISTLKPDGSLHASCTITGSKGGCAIDPLVAAGTHTIVVASSTPTASLQLQLVSDLSAGLNLGSPGAALNLARSGQSATYTFSAVAGQSVNLSITGVSIPGSSGIELSTPGGVSQYGSVAYAPAPGGSAYLVLGNLLTSGNYALRIKPQNGSVGNVTAALTQDKGGSLLVDGTPVAVSLSKQFGRYTFTGTSGQRLGLGFTGLTTVPAATAVQVIVSRPDQLELTSCPISASSDGCVLPPLPVGGNYTVAIASTTGSASFNLQLSTDLQSNLSLNASPAPVTIAKVGQAVTYTFAGTAGQNENLVASVGTIAGPVNVEVYRPDGIYLTSFSADKSAAVSEAIGPLPQTGSYKVRVIPTAGGTGSVTLLLRQDIAGSVSVGTAAVPVNLSYQSGSYNFSGTAGQRLGVSVAGLTTTPAGSPVSVSLMFDGSSVFDCELLKPADGCVLPILPSTGTYSLVLSAANSSASFNLQLLTDMGATIALNGAPMTLNVAKPGQAASFSFAGTMGQTMNAVISGVTFPGTSFFEVFDPNGDSVGAGVAIYAAGGGSGSIHLNSLALSGTYLMRVSPEQGGAGAVTAALTQDVGAALTVDGPAVAASLNHQTGRYTFTGATGQRLGLGLTGFTTIPVVQSAIVTLEASNGTTIDYCTLPSGSNTGCRFAALPANDTYTIVADSTEGQASFNIQLSSELTTALTIDGIAGTLNLQRVGQGGRFTFNGTAGQDLSLMLSGVTVPGLMQYDIVAPNGSVIRRASTFTMGGSPTGAFSPLGALPATGLYSVSFVAAGGTGLVSAAVRQVVAGSSLSVDSAPVATSLQKQSVRYSFNGTAGQRLGVGTLNLSTTPVGGQVMFYVQNAAGAQIQSGIAAAANGGFTLPVLAATGSYTVVASGTATSSAFGLQLSSDVSAALPATGTPVAVTVAKFGQGATYTFNATAGQNLNLSISGVTIPGTTLFRVTSADGSFGRIAFTNYTSGTGAGTTLALTGLPVTGVYTVRLEPSSGGTGSATLSLQ